MTGPSCPPATVAILPWGLLFEDFLDTIGVSLDAFCSEMTGGWLFNYVEALQSVQFRVLVVLVSARVDRPARLTHRPTGATVLVLPPPRIFGPLRAIRRGRFGRRLATRFRAARVLIEELEAYHSTPPLAFVRELRRDGCDAILCQEYEYARFDMAVLLGRRLGVPVFATFQGGTGGEILLQRAIRPLALRFSAGLVIGPKTEIERVQRRYGVPVAKIAQIFNPVDREAFMSTPRDEARVQLGLPADGRMAAWYGRVERHNKGLDVLMDAWERICRERPGLDLHLLMVGTGSDALWLRARIGQDGIRGIRWRDEYVHDRSTLRLHLSAADVFAFPSRHEGFPVAPIEAMACGLPVVAADAPGIPDILEGGEEAGGVVVPRGDAESFADALGCLIDDPTRCRQLGQRARRRAESCFSIGQTGRRLRDFLVSRGLPELQESIEVVGG